jgi:hypothetical protein
VPNIKELKDNILCEAIKESRLIINDLLDCCNPCKYLSGSEKRLLWILLWVCLRLIWVMIPFG